MQILSEEDWVDLAKLCLKKLEGEEGDKLKKFVNSSSKTGKPGVQFDRYVEFWAHNWAQNWA